MMTSMSALRGSCCGEIRLPRREILVAILLAIVRLQRYWLMSDGVRMCLLKTLDSNGIVM
jgi:hypothetical protein